MLYTLDSLLMVQNQPSSNLGHRSSYSIFTNLKLHGTLILCISPMCMYLFKVPLSPQDFEMLGWCLVHPVLPHGEKVPL